MNRKIYNIKKIGLVGLVGLMGLGQTSCSDFLEIEPLNEIIMDKFWNEKADVEGVIAGCYSAMQSEAVVKRMMVWGEFRSDNIGIGQNINNDSQLEKVLKENIDAKNGYTTWDGFYDVINRCNTVLKYAPGVAASDPAYTQSELRANIAEVTALRSLCYFYLIRTFRDVPYTTEAYTDDDQKMDLPATKFEDVLDSCINSLESVKDMAVKRYTVTKPRYQTGRITQDAIYAMLCEMYLWKQDYQNCIKYADLVIDSKKAIAKELKNTTTGYGGGGSSSSSNTSEERFNGFPLISSTITSGYYGNEYRTLFGSDDYAEQYNQEIIFQLIYDDDPRGNSMIVNKAVNDFYGNATSLIGLVAPSDHLLNDIDNPSQRTIFADRNKMLDARMYENCMQGNKSISKFVCERVQINATTTTNVETTYFNIYSDGQNTSNWIIYRLTDVMLMKAEALTQQLREGNEQSTIEYNTPILDRAFSLVNAINKRALCETLLTDTLVRSDYGTKSQMETLVYQERQRELMFEGKRWYDLVRISRRIGNTQELSQAAMRKAGSNSTMVQNMLTKMDAIYWPYNYEELKVNTNLVQNSAFSSGENESYAKNY